MIEWKKTKRRLIFGLIIYVILLIGSYAFPFFTVFLKGAAVTLVHEIIAGIGLLLAVALVAAVPMVIRFYSISGKYYALKKVASLVTKRAGKNFGASADSEEMKNGFESVLEQIRRNENRYRSLDGYIHLISLLKGLSGDTDHTVKVLDAYNIRFPNTGFIIAGFEIVGDEDAVNEPQRRDIRKKLRGIKGAVPAVFIMELDNRFICIFNPAYPEKPIEQESIKKGIEKYSNEAMENVIDTCHVELSAVISDIKNGIRNLAEAYNEVVQFFEYKKIIILF